MAGITPVYPGLASSDDFRGIETTEQIISWAAEKIKTYRSDEPVSMSRARTWFPTVTLMRYSTSPFTGVTGTDDCPVPF